MQVTTLAKRVIAGAGGVGIICGAVLSWQQLGWVTVALSSDIDSVEMQIQHLVKRIDGMDRLNLYRERDRVEDKIDELEDRAKAEPHNASLRELIRYRYRERDEIDRQIDALNKGG